MEKSNSFLSLLLVASALCLSCACPHTVAINSTPNDVTSIKFDHTFRSAKDAKVYQSLIERGFKSAGDPVNHPGRQTCEFIYFHKVRKDRAYIEFCYTNPALPKDYGDDEADPRDPWPGFALSPTSGPLKVYFNENEKSLQTFRAEYSHKNYDWAKDSTSILPGWNNINFKQGYDPIPGIFTWILEYEQVKSESEKGPQELEKLDLRRLELRKHKNTARYILGFVWSDNIPNGRTNLEKLSKGKTLDNRTYLMDGTWVQWIKNDSELGGLFRDKTYPYLAVVLGVDSLETFRKVASPDRDFKFFGRDASLIKLGPEGWDIIAVEVP